MGIKPNGYQVQVYGRGDRYIAPPKTTAAVERSCRELHTFTGYLWHTR